MTRDNLPSFSIASGLCGQLRELVLARRLDVLFTNDSFDDMDQLDSLCLLTEPFVLLLPRSSPGASMKPPCGRCPGRCR
nr:hypothetical protein [uncultured Azospirillum sp.]